MSIGNNIKKIRLEKNIKQKELAQKLNVSASMIAQYESGERTPKLETVRKIAEALGVYIGDLNPDWGSYSKEEIARDWKIASEEQVPGEQQLLMNYRSLNEKGQEKASEHVEMLTKIPEYRKED